MLTKDYYYVSCFQMLASENLCQLLPKLLHVLVPLTGRGAAA